MNKLVLMVKDRFMLLPKIKKVMLIQNLGVILLFIVIRDDVSQFTLALLNGLGMYLWAKQEERD